MKGFTEMANRKTTRKQKPATQTQAAKPRARATRKPRGNGSKPQVVTTLTHDQIASRAREIWLAKGMPEGQDEQNWLEAERQLAQATS